MSAKKYPVSLSEAAREELTRWSHSQRRSERERKRARILLLADEASVAFPDAASILTDAAITQTDAAIAQQVKVAVLTVHRVRQRFAERGLQDSLRRKEQPTRKARVLDGEAEAFLVALTCSTPPEGYKRWSLHLLKDTLIEQRVTDSISHETVRQTLKKMHLNPG